MEKSLLIMQKSRRHLTVIPILPNTIIPAFAVFAAVAKLNNRIRKCLGFRTSYEVFEDLKGIYKIF